MVSAQRRRHRQGRLGGPVQLTTTDLAIGGGRGLHWLLAAGLPQALAVVSDAVCSVMMVDATVVRYLPDAYDRGAGAGIARPSANDSNVEVALGLRLPVAYSLSRPWLMPVSSEIRPCVTPRGLSNMMIAPRSRLSHASRTSGRAQARSTTARTSEIAKATACSPFPWAARHPLR
jgi:hypothetical protein